LFLYVFVGVQCIDFCIQLGPSFLSVFWLGTLVFLDRLVHIRLQWR